MSTSELIAGAVIRIGQCEGCLLGGLLELAPFGGWYCLSGCPDMSWVAEECSIELCESEFGRDAFDTVCECGSDDCIQVIRALAESLRQPEWAPGNPKVTCESCESSEGMNITVHVAGPGGYHFETKALCNECFDELVTP